MVQEEKGLESVSASGSLAESLVEGSAEARSSEGAESKSAEARAEEIAREENRNYLEKDCARAKSLLAEDKVEALLVVVQSWPEDWAGQVDQKKEEMKKQAIEALGLENQDDGTQNMILLAVAEVIKENQVASKLTPPPASNFLKGICDQLDLAKQQHISNWKSWYENTDEGRNRWREILAEVE